jgi:hypothetical protein
VALVGRLTLSLNYQYVSIDRTFQGGDLIPDPQDRTASAAFLTLQAEYGLAPKVSILASYAYSDKCRKIRATGIRNSGLETEVTEYRGSGWGDLLLLAKYSLMSPTLISPMEVSIGGGAFLPTGSSSEGRDGTQLSQDLQPGFGTPSLLLWTFGSTRIPEHDLSFFISASYRYSGTNLDGYRVGDEMTATFSVAWTLNENFSIGVPARGRFQRKDFSNKRVLSGTGGTYWELMPEIEYYEGNAIARVFSSVPVFRSVSGIQLVPSLGIGAELSLAFDFR